jgi:hypothetical protein
MEWDARRKSLGDDVGDELSNCVTPLAGKGLRADLAESAARTGRKKYVAIEMLAVSSAFGDCHKISTGAFCFRTPSQQPP